MIFDLTLGKREKRRKERGGGRREGGWRGGGEVGRKGGRWGWDSGSIIHSPLPTQHLSVFFTGRDSLFVPDRSTLDKGDEGLLRKVTVWKWRWREWIWWPFPLYCNEIVACVQETSPDSKLIILSCLISKLQ